MELQAPAIQDTDVLTDKIHDPQYPVPRNGFADQRNDRRARLGLIGHDEVVLAPTQLTVQHHALLRRCKQLHSEIPDVGVGDIDSDLGLPDDSRLAEAALISELYKGLPTAHPVEGYFSSIENLTAEDAREFYKKNFVKGNIICGVAGSYPEGFMERFKGDLGML